MKSSNIITGLSADASFMPAVSFVYPSTKLCPAVKTGVAVSSSKIFVETIYS